MMASLASSSKACMPAGTQVHVAGFFCVVWSREEESTQTAGPWGVECGGGGERRGVLGYHGARGLFGGGGGGVM
jgi:hypothetical protein